MEFMIRDLTVSRREILFPQNFEAAALGAACPNPTKTGGEVDPCPNPTKTGGGEVDPCPNPTKSPGGGDGDPCPNPTKTGGMLAGILPASAHRAELSRLISAERV